METLVQSSTVIDQLTASNIAIITSNAINILTDKSVATNTNPIASSVIDTNPAGNSNSSLLPVILGVVGGSLLGVCIIIWNNSEEKMQEKKSH